MKRLFCFCLAMMLLLTACGNTADPPPIGNRVGDTCIGTTLTEIGPDGVIRHTFTGAINYDTLLSAVNSCR